MRFTDGIELFLLWGESATRHLCIFDTKRIPQFDDGLSRPDRSRLLPVGVDSRISGVRPAGDKRLIELTNHSTSSKSLRYREGATGCDAVVSKYCANPRIVTGETKKLFDAGDVNDPGLIAMASRLLSDR